jgi:hypothetical protein
MIHVNKKMMASGIAGVLIASLIIVSIVIAPSSELAKLFSPHTSSVTQKTSSYLETPLRINLSISSFDPDKLGGEANLSITVTHFYWDSPSTSIQIYQVEGIGGLFENKPRGVILIGDNLWQGYLEANVSVSFNVKVKANQIGNWTIEVAAMSIFASNLWYGNIEDLRISVYEDKVLVAYLGSPLDEPSGVIKTQAYVGNVTEPSGLGSEADLTVIISSSKDVFNATAYISLPKGISLVSGNATWSGCLKANISISLKARIKFLAIGNWFVQVRGEGIGWISTPLWSIEEGEFIEVIAPVPAIFVGGIAVHVFTDKIAVSDGWIIY